MNKIEVFKLDKAAKIPARNHPDDAGIDLFATEDVFIPKGSTKLIQTKIAVNIKPGYVGMIFGRSSLNKKGIIASQGVIDAGFSGSLGVILNNFSADTERDAVLFQSGYQVKAGDKIGQLVIFPIVNGKVEEVQQLWASDRGNKGYGSSGR